eukprot:9690188-Heterocapsa_arctica.AAC.1
MDIALPRRGGVRRVPCHCIIPGCQNRSRADGVRAAGLDLGPLERGSLKIGAVGAWCGGGAVGRGS